MRFMPAYKESRDSVKVPFFDKLVELSEQRPEEGARILRRSRIQKILVTTTWLCLVLAAAKPQWIGAPIEQQKSGRDLMVAVDLSGSMEARDFSLPDGTTLNRLEAVKRVLDELARQRASDRLGLIVFGAAAYLQTPFTDDHEVWRQLLGETEIGMAGPSTVFGDAIGLAIKLFRENASDNRVLILLTDGNDTGSTVPPIDAAKVAAANEIRIYTIAIGDPATVGEDALDMQTIERVSELTGGASFQALDQDQMHAAYETIASMEPELYESVSFRPKQSLHWVPVAAAVVLFLCYHLFMALWTWRQGRQSRAT
ncbi:VWA domain-containing protein [Halioglobus maricola]|uniref:VWA domain-containing protein n=2 Tax=Halioglobus maricola TaxID=2601894 RepID=A0A5P9NPW6_9GAMM|nr:VWA domain-containing protein [Halioglobus maricola]